MTLLSQSAHGHIPAAASFASISSSSSPTVAQLQVHQQHQLLSLYDSVRAGKSQRSDFPLVASKCALLVIDVQSYLKPSWSDRTSNPYFPQAHTAALPNIQHLLQGFRGVRDESYHEKQNDNDHPDHDDSQNNSKGCEVIWSYLQSLTRDGRDISWDYKLSGHFLNKIPRSDTPFQDLFLSNCSPLPNQGKGDILLPKTSCNVFVSTNIKYVLQTLQVQQLVICGQLTDQCVESTVRTAADLGYFVTVVEDACIASTLENHQRGLAGMKGFSRCLTTQQVLAELHESAHHSRRRRRVQRTKSF